jgi:8-oxo-dGTP diphosphatase
MTGGCHRQRGLVESAIHASWREPSAAGQTVRKMQRHCPGGREMVTFEVSSDALVAIRRATTLRGIADIKAVWGGTRSRPPAPRHNRPFSDAGPMPQAIVERDGALLLVRRAGRLSEGGEWGLPGGFLDRDENLAEGVRRELREETGWDGRVLRLLRINSRPDRPREDRQNVAFDFVLAPLARVGEPDDESSDVAWVPIDQLPALDELVFDHGDTVRLYLASRGRPAAAPLLDQG